ncbi:MAG: hypothetical protein GF383_02655 [Candidatus Lokiarchaeota archaeon]|nr:hypothetical protein [Candidatus Lokiarchaeota archaeon]MBD3338333.1 hypothetical protein [Candidatus Lokiarchaeota archaeon]
MINNRRDVEAKELEAMQLIDRAESLADEGKGEESINLFEKAAQIYLDFGSYLKLDELYIKIANVVSKFKNNIQAIYRLKSIIRKTEELKLDEISAKLLIQLGNIAYKMKDWETAADSWSKASDYFYESDPEIYYNLSSELLLRAGQALEWSNQRRDEGERLILKAVMTINKFDDLYHMEEKRALNLLSMNEFEAAANKYREISIYFDKATENINELMEESENLNAIKNAKARIMHLTAEYKAVAALCLRASKNRAYNEEIKQIGTQVIDLLKSSIQLLKEVFQDRGNEIDKEDRLRITFDTLLLSIMQGMLGKKEINSLKFLMENISNKKLIKNLKATPFYKLTERIEKVGIRESLDKLSETHLGHLDKVKEELVPFFV